MRFCCLSPAVRYEANRPGSHESQAADSVSSGNILPCAAPSPDSPGAGGALTSSNSTSSNSSSLPSSASAAALQSKLKVQFADLTFHQLIGKGSFKQVYRGKWNNTNVAIVSMRKGGMVTEARVLQRLSSHPNLVQFYRWSTDDKGNEYMVIELVPFGSLDKVLVNFGNALRNRSKLVMCEQMCSAMSELVGEGVLHRDMAARNILVQSMEPVHVKVVDFGLARVAPNWVPQEPATTTMVPVRWSPPEVLQRAEWSEKSDVWSYGVTIWEIFSNGAEPYASKSDSEAAAAIIAGEVLPRPPKCPKPVYVLMLECWRLNPADRPTFQHIGSMFKTWKAKILAAKSNRSKAASAEPSVPHGHGSDLASNSHHSHLRGLSPKLPSRLSQASSATDLQASREHLSAQVLARHHKELLLDAQPVNQGDDDADDDDEDFERTSLTVDSSVLGTQDLNSANRFDLTGDLGDEREPPRRHALTFGSTMAETCVLSMEVETVIEPMISYYSTLQSHQHFPNGKGSKDDKSSTASNASAQQHFRKSKSSGFTEEPCIGGTTGAYADRAYPGELAQFRPPAYAAYAGHLTPIPSVELQTAAVSAPITSPYMDISTWAAQH